MSICLSDHYAILQSYSAGGTVLSPKQGWFQVKTRIALLLGLASLVASLLGYGPNWP